MRLALKQDWSAVEGAFSKQAHSYDSEDEVNSILQDWRQKVYRHVDRFLKPHARILELNAGTGIDALHFVENGHEVLATDISSGMIRQIERKILQRGLQGRLKARQCSFIELDQLPPSGDFDFVFSNFGGLNCLNNLVVFREPFRNLLSPGAYLTLVVMPIVSPWEMASSIRGNPRCFRRFARGGTNAQLEGYQFKTYYHPLNRIARSLGSGFKLVACESLGLCSPPPSAAWMVDQYPGIYQTLRRIDNALSTTFPFNRWGDHLIVTFRFG